VLRPVVQGAIGRSHPVSQKYAGRGVILKMLLRREGTGVM
jgi:hypothetical protein